MSITYNQLAPVVSALDERIKTNLNAYPTDKAEGAGVTYTDGAEAPLKSFVVDIEPIQDGEGDPSPSNVRPITGWGKVNIRRCKKNLIKLDNEVTANGITFTPQSDGGVKITGTATANAYRNIFSWSPLKSTSIAGCAGQKLILSGGTSQVRITLSYRKDASSTETPFINESGDTPVTLPSDKTYQIYFALRVVKDTTIDTVIYPMLRIASNTDATFEAYEGDNYSITFPTEAGTVYGGNLDVVTGMLTVDKAGVMLADQSIRARNTATEGLYRFAFSPKNACKAGPRIKVVSSNVLKSVTASETYDNGKRVEYGIGNDANDNIINFFSTDIQSVEAWENFATTFNVQVVYQLETPITYQLTAVEVKSLLGINSIYADAGNVSVEYRANASLYINRKIAEAIAALS